MSTDPVADELLHDILKQVSRSFYLTLNVLPLGVRDQMGLSYLFARAADTIADTDLIDRAQRLKYLNLFRAQFTTAAIDWAAVREVQTALVPHQKDSAEGVLLQRLEDCLRLYEEFSPDDRERIQWLMSVLPNGMEMDLTRFPGESSGQLAALINHGRAGSVYLLCCRLRWRILDSDGLCASPVDGRLGCLSKMSAIGVRFGKGLQLADIVKER